MPKILACPSRPPHPVTALTIMLNWRMCGRLRFIITAAMGLVSLMMVSSMYAETNSLPKARPGILPLKVETSNDTVTFSWPVLPGKWELLQKSSASDSKWQAVSDDQYHTNANMVSATLPLPKDGMLYRVKRNVAIHAVSSAMAPPLPEAPTNRPVPKASGH